MVVQGLLNISKRHAFSKCAYKYVLLNKTNKATYEEIVEFRPWKRGHVNRCLVIKEEFVTKTSKLTKIE